MAAEPVPLIALTYHTIANSIAKAEGDTYVWPDQNVARNVIVCGFADFDPDGAITPERKQQILDGTE